MPPHLRLRVIYQALQVIWQVDQKDHLQVKAGLLQVIWPASQDLWTVDQVDQGGWKNRPNPRGRVTHPALGSLSCVLADGAGADVPGWLEDGRQGAPGRCIAHAARSWSWSCRR